VVRELPRDDPRRAQDEWEAEEEEYAELDMEQRRKLWRERRWVHYPTYEDDNTGRSAFKQAEWDIWRAEREMRRARKRQRNAVPLVLDLDHIPPEATAARAPDAPLGLPRVRQFGTLIASGGVAGYGNPHFYSTTNPSPKFATRGYEGERVTLELELKLLADVGLVGAPNAGKSTLLRALTAGRARSTVAGYAFTTLNPVVGVVRVAEDGSVLGGDDGGGNGESDVVYDETVVERRRERELMESGAFADLPTRNRAQGDVHEQQVEAFRFTVADNPGLIEDASDNVGLGHSFLRSMERSHALVYVVDLSAPAPWDELRMLREELEKYKVGMSGRARMVIANKADLLAGEGDPEEVRLARAKLARLEEFVRDEMDQGDRVLDVVPISGKYGQNLHSVLRKLRTYVEEARSASQTTPIPLHLSNVPQS
jgi:GTP-binding protein